MIEKEDLISQLTEVIEYLKDDDEDLAYDTLHDIVNDLDDDDDEEYEEEEEDI